VSINSSGLSLDVRCKKPVSRAIFLSLDGSRADVMLFCNVAEQSTINFSGLKIKGGFPLRKACCFQKISYIYIRKGGKMSGKQPPFQ